jgi:hypothetical protein
MPPPVHPELATNERVLAEVALGIDTAVLTDRRIVVAGRNLEQSLPLAHIGLVRVRFERTVRDIVFGVVAIVVAIVLFAIASPVRTFFLNQSTGLEAAVRQERENPGDAPGLAHGMQRLVGALATVAGAIPVVAWLALVLAAAKIALGIIGRTVVTLTAGGGEVAFAKRGRDRLLHDFIAEVGRHLPGPPRAAG